MLSPVFFVYTEINSLLLPRPNCLRCVAASELQEPGGRRGAAGPLHHRAVGLLVLDLRVAATRPRRTTYKPWDIGVGTCLA